MTEERYEVLFVDDGPNILKAIKRNLKTKCNICIADNIKDAIEKIESCNFPVVVAENKYRSTLYFSR